MAGDLPDYQKYIWLVSPDVFKVDHWKIKGLTLKDPYIALSVPMSVENPALAYNEVTDRFKIDIEALSCGVIPVSFSNDWTRQLGQVDLARVLGAALSHSNPVITRLTNGSSFIDPRDRSWTITENLNRSWVLGSSDVPDLMDRAGRLLGVIANTSFQVSNFPSNFALESGGNLAALVAKDFATQTTLASVLAQLDSKTSTLFKSGQNIGNTSFAVSSVDATATPVQISIAGLNGNSAALYTPAAGKAVRLKFVSLEHSADVTIGYRFGAAGTIYYLRITKGVYISNLIGCNNQGAANAALYLNSSGATNVYGYFLVGEV